MDLHKMSNTKWQTLKVASNKMKHSQYYSHLNRSIGYVHMEATVKRFSHTCRWCSDEDFVLHGYSYSNLLGEQVEVQSC